MSFFTGFMQGAATEAVEIQKENKTRRQELVDKAMDRFYEFTLPEQRKYAERQRKLTSTMNALEAAGYSKGEARALISASGEDATAAQILQYAKPPKGRTTATEAAPEMDQTTAALGAGTTEPTAAAATETAGTAGMAPEMPTAGAAPEVSAPTDTQTASTKPAGGFDLGRVLFDQNSPERTTGAILAALSAETGLKPEQIDAYLRGEFGSDVMQGEMAPIELEPVSAGERWKEEQERDRMRIAQENTMSLEEFRQKHDFALAEEQHRNALSLAEKEAELKAKEAGTDIKPVDISRVSKDAVNGVAGSGLYGEFTTTIAGDVIWSVTDPSISAQAQLHSAMASDEAVARMIAAQNPNSGVSPNIATGASAAQSTRVVIETARDAEGFIARGRESGQSVNPDYYTQKAAEAVSGLYSNSAINTAVEAMYAAWRNAAQDDATRQAIDASLENVRRMQAGG